MNIELTEEQVLLTDTFARFFSNESSTERVRKVEPLGYDPELWKQLVELGTPAIRVAEEHGGGAMSLRDITLISYQAGYHIASAPVAECAVAAKLLSDVGGDVALEWLNKILDGSAIVGVAAQPIAAAPKQVISCGAIADAVLTLDGNQLKLITTEQTPARAVNLGSQPIAYWDLAGSDQVVLAEGDDAVAAYEMACEEWKLLLASQLSGISARCLEYAAEYSNEREAFGVRIGTFQGLAHPLADCAIAVDGAKILVDYAIWKLEAGHEDAAAYISMAYWWATEAASQTMPQAVHIFGGYGVSEEHDIQLFARRGMALSSILGDRQQELLTIAQRKWGDATTAVPAAGETAIDFSFGESAEKIREHAREFFDEAFKDEELAAQRGHSWDTYHPKMTKKLAEANMLFPEWPEEWGGMNTTPSERLALSEVFCEKRWTEYPQGTSRIVGGMIQKFGSDEIKKKVLPGIMSGDVICTLGLTEPHCGSDVFEAKTKAVRKGDKWLINGQKMFTSGANIGQYVMLLTNTNPEAPKHVGKTLFLVPLDHPGVEVHRVDTISEDRTNITYYTDIELDDAYRLGDVDNGSKVMGYMLKLEQGGCKSHYELKHLLDQAVSWSKKTERNGKLVFDDPLAQIRLATALVHFEVSNVFLLRITANEERGVERRDQSSMLKVFCTESWKKDGADLLNMASPDSLFADTPGMEYIESGWRTALASAIYAGTTQVHRSVVAEIGLGMPRSR